MSFQISLPPGFELEVNLPEGFALEDNSASTEVRPPPGFHLEKPTPPSARSNLGSAAGSGAGASSAGFSAPVGSTSVVQSAVSPKQAQVRPPRPAPSPSLTQPTQRDQDRPQNDLSRIPSPLEHPGPWLGGIPTPEERRREHVINAITGREYDPVWNPSKQDIWEGIIEDSPEYQAAKTSGRKPTSRRGVYDPASGTWSVQNEKDRPSLLPRDPAFDIAPPETSGLVYPQIYPQFSGAISEQHQSPIQYLNPQREAPRQPEESLDEYQFRTGTSHRREKIQFARDAVAAREATLRKGGDAGEAIADWFITLGDPPHFGKEEVTPVQAIMRAGGRFIGEMAVDPTTYAFMGTGALGKVGSRAVAGLFAAQGIYGTYRSGTQLYHIWNRSDITVEQKYELLTNTVLNGLMAFAAGKHAIHPQVIAADLRNLPPEALAEIQRRIEAKSQLQASETTQPELQTSNAPSPKPHLLAEENPTRAAAELLDRYDKRVNPQPESKTPIPAKPPGPNYLSPERIDQFATDLAELPLAQRADAMVQAQQQMTEWMTDRIGKPWMGPDHKLHIVRSPQEAEKLALEFINNQVDLHDQRLAEAQNRSGEATEPYPNEFAQPAGNTQALPSVGSRLDTQHISQTPADQRSVPPMGHNMTQDSAAAGGVQQIPRSPSPESEAQQVRLLADAEKMNPGALEQFTPESTVTAPPQFYPGQQVILRNGEPGTVAKFVPNLNRVVVQTDSGFRTIRPADLQIPVIQGTDPVSVGSPGGSLTIQSASSSGDLSALPVLGGTAVEGLPEVAEVNAANDELIGTYEIPQSPTQRSDVPTGPPPQVYVGVLRGKRVELQDVRTVKMTYTKRARKKYVRLRREFNPIRRVWIQDLANNPEHVRDLQQAGVTGNELAQMKKGRLPQRWAVHHKLPLDDNGTNDFLNFIFTEKDPAHYVFTNAQRYLTGDLMPGESRSVDFPMPDGFVYPPRPNMVKIHQ